MSDSESANSKARPPSLGVDFGTVRIGLALGFPDSGLVVPLDVLPHPRDDAAAAESVARLAAERGVGQVIFGNPINKDGTASAMSQRILRVAERVRAALPDVPVVLQDERYTSQDAEARLLGLGLRWWQIDKGRIDAMAAMAIVRRRLIQDDPRLGLISGEEPPAEDPPVRDSRRDRRRRARRRRGG